jgi:hypothetical protein
MDLSQDLLRAALEGLEAAKTRIEGQIESIRASLGIKRRGRPRKTAASQEPPKRKRRKMSAAARKRIGDATRKRWAALRKAKG